MTTSENNNLQSWKDILSLCYYAAVAKVLCSCRFIVNWYFEAGSLVVILLILLQRIKLCTPNIVDSVWNGLEAQKQWVTDLEPFRYPFAVLFRCIVCMVILLFLPAGALLLLAYDTPPELKYPLSISIGVSISTILISTIPWHLIRLINCFVFLDLYTKDDKLTANAYLLKYFICGKNVNMIVYTLYFFFLSLITVYSCLDKHLFDSGIDNAIKSAFLIHIAYTNMVAKVKDVDTDTQAMFNKLFDSVIHGEKKLKEL